MKPKLLLFAVMLSLFVAGCEKRDGSGGDSRTGAPTQEALAALARCLTEQGFVMYGSITCSACRAQRKAFGPAFAYIEEIECNPHAANTQVERCLERKIQTTPTWIAEKNGKEIRRLEGYQLLEDLASFAGCAL
jgi:hypothetical protein